MRPWNRIIFLFIIALGLIGCAGARPQITFHSAMVPVSMSSVVLGREGQPLAPEDQIPLGRFTAEKKGWAMFYSFLPLNSTDFSEELNSQVAAVKGDAVVNLEVAIMNSSCFPLHLIQYTQILPIFIGCVDVSLEGDIIQARRRTKAQPDVVDKKAVGSVEKPAPQSPSGIEGAKRETSTPPHKPVYLVVLQAANIREEANTKSRVIVTLKKGDQLEKIRESGGWCNVKLPSGQTGWVSKSLVKEAVF